MQSLQKKTQKKRFFLSVFRIANAKEQQEKTTTTKRAGNELKLIRRKLAAIHNDVPCEYIHHLFILIINNSQFAIIMLIKCKISKAICVAFKEK